MAAVLCLVFIPIVASVGFMFGTIDGQLSAGSALAGATFFVMAAGILFGMFRMSRPWDNAEGEQD